LNYCSNCGSDQLQYVIPPGDSYKRYVCKNCHVVHYINPRVIVGCLPIYEDKLVICKRAINPCKGKWNLPAGFMENNESAENGALRELKEETGLEGKILKLHCVYSIPHVNQVYLIFLTKINDLKIDPGEESLEVSLFDLHEIPWGDIGFTSSVFAIEKYMESLNHSDLRTFIGSYLSDGPENREEFINAK
jgi:ADP-ribose pyrophosphatase YjhB (NUDIX family)